MSTKTPKAAAEAAEIFDNTDAKALPQGPAPTVEEYELTPGLMQVNYL